MEAKVYKESPCGVHACGAAYGAPCLKMKCTMIEHCDAIEEKMATLDGMTDAQIRDFTTNKHKEAEKLKK